jgi:hypothetical protein
VPTLDLSGLQILDDPGIGGNVAIARAALRHFGEFYRPDGAPWVGWCEMFIGNVLAEANIAHPRYESAIVDAINGPLYRGHAPTGSLVFFDQQANPYGHVGVSLGDGTMLSALGGGIARTTYMDWASYLGWRPYGTTDTITAEQVTPEQIVERFRLDDRFLITALTPPPPGDPVGTPTALLGRDQGDWYEPPAYLASQQIIK